MARDFEVRLANLKLSAAAALDEAVHLKAGNPRIDKAQQIAVQHNKAAAEKRRKEIVAILDELRKEGYSSYSQLAKALNDRGIKPLRARAWTTRNLHSLEHPQDR
jgi:flagellar motility protein MotE (MotC chaperone)